MASDQHTDPPVVGSSEGPTNIDADKPADDDAVKPGVGDVQNSANHDVKFVLDFDMPLTEQITGSKQFNKAPEPFQVRHLHLNLDVSKVVRLAQQGSQVQVILPDKTYSVPADAISEALFSNDQQRGLAATYRTWGVYPALQLISQYPNITHLDIDTAGTLPENNQVKQALTINNMAAFSFVVGRDLQSLRNITIQMGHNLDTYVGSFKDKYDLKTSTVIDEGMGPDVYDLSYLRDQLRGGKGCEGYPNDLSRALDAEEEAEEAVRVEKATRRTDSVVCKGKSKKKKRRAEDGERNGIAKIVRSV
jgi:hypothetical protein